MKVSLGDGYRILETSDGEEALRLAQEHTPDVVILDLMVPGLNGLEVLRALRADPTTKETSVAVVSAWSEVESEARTAGADEFIPKPFEPDDFRDRISGMVSRS
jgi:DNA-binding response OmpR family regulator